MKVEKFYFSAIVMRLLIVAMSLSLASCASLHGQSAIDNEQAIKIAKEEVIKIATIKALAEGWLEGEFFIKKISLFENGWVVWIESKIPTPGGQARMMISPDGKVIEYWGGA